MSSARSYSATELMVLHRNVSICQYEYQLANNTSQAYTKRISQHPDTCHPSDPYLTHSRRPAEEAESVTAHAILSGYRHADSAIIYCNEQPTAAGMLKGGAKLSIPREELFFTSKVPPNSINYADAKACVKESLEKTGLGYFDLFLLHAPYGGKEGRLGAWKALVEAVEEGKVRSIGVSNYGVHHLEELEEWQKVRPFISLSFPPMPGKNRNI